MNIHTKCKENNDARSSMWETDIIQNAIHIYYATLSLKLQEAVEYWTINQAVDLCLFSCRVIFNRCLCLFWGRYEIHLKKPLQIWKDFNHVLDSENYASWEKPGLEKKNYNKNSLTTEKSSDFSQKVLKCHLTLHVTLTLSHTLHQWKSHVHCTE